MATTTKLREIPRFVTKYAKDPATFLANPACTASVRRLKLLVIAYNCAPSEEYVQRLRALGHSVFWVGQGVGIETYIKAGQDVLKSIEAGDMEKAKFMLYHMTNAMRVRPDLDIKEIHGAEKMFSGPLGDVPVPHWRMDLSALLNVIGEGHEDIGEDFDAIVHFQNWLSFPDIDKSPIPYLYIATEPFYPPPPKAAWVIATPSAQYSELYAEKYGGKYRYATLPWACREGVRSLGETKLRSTPDFFDEKSRPTGCSFAGKIHGYKFYDERRSLVLKIEEILGRRDNAGLFEGSWDAPNQRVKGIDPVTGQEIDTILRKPERGAGYINILDYVNMLARSRFGLNWNTPYGANFRDFEIPACGAIPLTRETRDMKDLGFKDGETCIFFNTAEEAAEIVKSGYDPAIATDAYAMIQMQHTYGHRLVTLMNIINKMVD